MAGALSCSICKDSWHSGDSADKKFGVLKCGHIFHKSCVYAWWEELGRASSLRNCPICQKIFYYDSMINAYPTLQSSDTCVQVTEMEAEHKKIKEELNEMKAANEASKLEAQIIQHLKLEIEFLEEALTNAFSNCETLQMQVQNLQRTSDSDRTSMNEVTRLNSFTGGLQTQVINEESEPSQNVPLDLSIRPGFNSRDRADGTANADDAENIDSRFEHLQMTQI